MNFEFSEEQSAIGELAQSIFRDHCDDDRIREIYESGDIFDERLWQSLAETGLLAAALPETCGGSGLGMLDLGLILEAQGATLGAVPFWRHQIASLAIASFGSDALKNAHLPKLINGSAIASLWNESSQRSALQAKQSSNGWSLSGTAHHVVLDARTKLVLVIATLPDGRDQLFVVPTDAPALDAVRGTSSNDESVADLTFNDVEVSADALLACPDAVEWLELRCCLAIAALQLGVTGEALQRAALYVSERHQFGRPIGSFQAVAMRMAEAYIQLELLRTAQWQLAWRLDEGLPAMASARIAKFQASEAGHIIGHTAQHYHGGIGADLTYPVHRFFLWASALDLASGGAEMQLGELARLGLPEVVGFEQCLSQ